MNTFTKLSFRVLFLFLTLFYIATYIPSVGLEKFNQVYNQATEIFVNKVATHKEKLLLGK